MDVTQEQGHTGPAMLNRLYNSTYIHIPTGKTYIQTAFPQGTNWIEDTPGDMPAVDDVTIGYNGLGQLIALSAGGSETLAQTLVFGSVTGGTDIKISTTDMIVSDVNNSNGNKFMFGPNIPDGDPIDSWALFSDGGNYNPEEAGVYVDSSGYAALFGSGWGGAFEVYAGGLAWYTAEGSVYGIAEADGSSIDRYTISGGGGGRGIQVGDEAYDNSTDGRTSYGSTLISTGDISIVYAKGGFLGGERIVGVSMLSAEKGTIGYAGQVGSVPHYSTIIASGTTSIKGDGSGKAINALSYNSIVSSDNSHIITSRNVSIIASESTTVTDLEHFIVLGMGKPFTYTGAGFRDFSAVVNTLYVDDVINHKIRNADPITPVDGDSWLKDTGGVRTLNARIAGVTYSTVLT